MKFSKRTIFTLFILLIILNLVLRFPVTPHETGNDSFAYHALANSISSFGHAKWLLHPLSVFGLYPYSYASAVPFAVSGVSQCTGIGMEWTIGLFAAFLGVLSIFTAYLLAGEIMNNDIFKFLVAFGFSTSQSMLFSTSWGIETRGLFIVLLPMFVYLLLRSRTFKLQYGRLSFGLFVLLAVTHHLFWLVIPIIVIYLILLIIYKVKLNYNDIKIIKVPKRFSAIALLILFVVLSLSMFYIQNPLVRYQASIAYMLKSMIFTYARYIGVFGIFAIVGLFLLLFKQNKSFEEWFLILMVLYITPIFNAMAYMFQFSAIFVFLLAGMGMLSLINTLNLYKERKNRRILYFIYNKKRTILFSIIIVSFLFSVVFSGFFQCWHPNIGGGYRYFETYMEETEYTSAFWIKQNINGSLACNDYLLARRTLAISEVPILTGSGSSDIVWRFINEDELKLETRLPTDVRFYTDSPVSQIGPATSWYFSKLMQVPYNDRWGKQLILKYNITHVIENENIHEKYCLAGMIRHSPFFESIHECEQKVYDNGHVSIWSLE